MAETPYKRTDDAAAYLGVSPRTLEKWRREGSGPGYVRLGTRLVAYEKNELDRWARRANESAAGAA